MGKGKPLEKDPEIEKILDERVGKRCTRGLKIKYNDEYHVTIREIARRHYWRRKLLKEKKQSPGSDVE